MRRLRQEDGLAALPMLIIALPLLMVIFGLAIDGARGHYAAQQVTGNVQSAISAGVSQINTKNGKIVTADAKTYAIDSYTKNRAQFASAVRCAKSSDLKSGETLQGDKSCRWILSSFKSSGYTITMQVREFSPNLWSRAIKKDFAVSARVSASTSYN